MDYKGKRKGKGEASSNKRTHSEYEVDDHENLTNLGPSFIQHDIPGEDPLDIETSYVMAIDPAILETTKGKLTNLLHPRVRCTISFLTNRRFYDISVRYTTGKA